MSALNKSLDSFSFLVGVSGIDVAEHLAYEDALIEAGCNDALILVVNGELRLDFDREASSYESAIASATSDIERAGGKVEYVERMD
jgi:uncharacterized SAM-dependent methyltransferase